MAAESAAGRWPDSDSAGEPRGRTRRSRSCCRFDLTGVETMNGEPNRHAEPFLIRGHVSADRQETRASQDASDLGTSVAEEFAKMVRR